MSYIENMKVTAEKNTGFRCNRLYICKPSVFLATIFQNRLHYEKDILWHLLTLQRLRSVLMRIFCFSNTHVMDYDINENKYFAIEKLYGETQNCISRINILR